MKQIQRARISLAIVAIVIVVMSLGVVRAVSQLKPVHTSTSLLTTTQTAQGNVTPTVIPLLSPLSVRGNQIMNDHGQAVTLIGAARNSLEYLCDGDGHFTAADFHNMRAWGMNVVRIPLSSEFWGTCPGYHVTVTAAVSAAEAAGLYVVLTLQWNAPFDTEQDRKLGGVQCPLPDNKQDVRFWQDLAQIYHNDANVLFDLFSEPHDVSWQVWLHGGTIQSGCYRISTNSSKIAGTYTAVGMQELADDVHAITPSTILIVSGINWGFDLSQIAKGYQIHGTTIVYGTHPFDYNNKQPSDWPSSFGKTAKQFAVIVTEFGSYDCSTSYNNAAISYFKTLHISWLAWSWNITGCGGPSLLSKWPDTPSTPYGDYIRTQMLALTKQSN